MKQSVFVSVILMLLVVWMEIYHSARELYNGLSEARAEVSRLKSQTDDVRLEATLEHEHFLEFRQNIATLMPDVLEHKGIGPNGYAYLSLESVFAKKESAELRFVIAKTLFESGKR